MLLFDVVDDGDVVVVVVVVVVIMFPVHRVCGGVCVRTTSNPSINRNTKSFHIDILRCL